MKAEKLASLGEVLRSDFQAIIRSCTVDGLDNGDSIGVDLPELRKIGAEVEQLIRIGFSLRDLEAYTNSKFIPSDLAMPDDETDFTVSGIKFDQKDFLPTGAGLETDDEKAHQTSTLSLGKTVWKDFQESMSTYTKGGDENLGLTVEDFQGLRSIGSDIEQLIGIGSDFLEAESDDQVLSKFGSLLSDSNQFPESSEQESDAQAIDTSEEEFRGAWNREFDAPIKDLKDFARLLESSPYEHRSPLAEGNQPPESSPQMREYRGSMPLPSEEEVDEATQFPHRIPLEKNRMKKETIAPSSSSPYATEQKRLTDLPAIDNDESIETAADISEFDLDQILEALAQKIHREYKRFYGS